MEVKFYADAEKKCLNEALLTDDALKWANSFIRPTTKRGRNPRLNMNQLRRFFQDARQLEAKVNTAVMGCRSKEIRKQAFLTVKPLIKMYKSKVAYACPSDDRSGSNRKIPVEFRQFMEDMINPIKDEKDFRAFMFCFEAVVGYFYGEGGR